LHGEKAQGKWVEKKIRSKKKNKRKKKKKGRQELSQLSEITARHQNSPLPEAKRVSLTRHGSVM
jgi:hypothetical protein